MAQLVDAGQGEARTDEDGTKSRSEGDGVAVHANHIIDCD